MFPPGAMNTDRNLLFGVLAFQNEYINLSQLAAVCRAWSAEKDRPLAELLVERRWIDSHARVELDRLVDRKLARYGGDPRATLGAVADYSVRDAIRDVDDADVRQSLAGLQPSAGHVLVETLAKPTEGRSRYTLSRLHGEGGLGRVWVARDGDLNREVALKELRPERGISLDASRRFLVEAQVTGQLEHPNIVPVYELSRRPEDNQPFYTMRFVRGQTLRDAIAAYHRHVQENRIDPLELPRLLGAFISVCNAMAYAHTRGVVHRDLKPENVVMGAFGEVLVLDWGLAKLMGKETGPYDSTTDLPVAITPAADGERTIAGRVMGTPAYMAPEQAEGRTELVDSRTDIYGLGAILYEILAGHPPHEGNSTADILNKIVTGETPRARAISPHVPGALDAIGAKAMAKVRSERYRNAAELAEDVQRWLADEPVSVHADSLTQRMWRWARRHRAAALATMIAFGVISAVSVTAAVWIQHARHQETIARKKAEAAQRAESEARERNRQLFTGFRQAVDTLLTTFGTELENVPGGQEVRQPLLQEAAAAYQELVAKGDDDPELQLDASWTLIRLARGRVQVGDFPGAEADLRAAEATLAKLTEFARADTERRYAWAASRLETGLIYSDMGRVDEASGAVRSAVEEYESLSRISSNAPPHSHIAESLANALVHWGGLLMDAGRNGEAELALHRAVQKYDAAADSDPEEPRFRVGLATAHKVLGQLLAATGRPEAAESFEAAVEQCRRLAAMESNPEYHERLAASRRELAQLRFTLGRWADAEREYRAAIDDFRKLTEDDPQVAAYHERLAATLSNLAVVLRSFGETAEAERMLKEALGGYEKYLSLVDSSAPPIAYRAGRAACLTSLGQLLRDAGRNTEAEEALRSAITEFQRLAGDLPGNPQFHHGLAVARANLGYLLRQTGQVDDAEKELRLAIATSRKLIENNADVPEFADAQALNSRRLADILYGTDRQSEAIELYRVAIALRGRIARELPHIPDHSSRLAWLLTTCPHEELRDADRALKLARSAAEQVTDNGSYQSVLGIAQFRSGDGGAGKATLETAVNLRPVNDPACGFFLAMCLHRLGEKEAASQQYDRAVGWMREKRPQDPELIAIRDEALRLLSSPLEK
jgi:serine/threonine-protein kinase